VVAADVRRQIVTGALAEGDTLGREDELMEQYGVSRPTLREAIRILETQSLISVRQGSRAGPLVHAPDIRVAALHAAIRLQVDETPLHDVFAARIELGVAAARRLARQHDPAAVARLAALHHHELAEPPDQAGHPLAITAFHAAVVELGGNRTLALLRAVLEEIALAHERRLPNVEQGWIATAHDHDQAAHAGLIEAVGAGDADGAEQLWRDHLTTSADTILARLGRDTVVDLLGHDGLGRS
jgi:DNA-binding FadR family transcriptional regulator